MADRRGDSRRRRDRVFRLGQAHAPAVRPRMKFPDLEYINWAKSRTPVDVNLARSGIDHCPESLLGLKASDLVATLPVKYGYRPPCPPIARLYAVDARQAFPPSRGPSFPNWPARAPLLPAPSPLPPV